MDYARYYLGSLFMVAGVAGFALGGGWVWLGASTFAVAVALDLLSLEPDYSARVIRYPALAEIPVYLHPALLTALVVSAALRLRADAMSHAPLSVAHLGGVVATLGWLGVLPNIPATHELIHRQGRVPRLLGFWCALVIADPLRRLAHLRGHHTKLGLTEDSDTARRGESIYAFMLRAAVGGTLEAFRSEQQRLAKSGRRVWSYQSDVTWSLLFTALLFAALAHFAGSVAALTIAAGFVVSRFLLESFNYLQHYGLVRVPGERYDRRHTWSHLTPVVRAAALEITNHAHHHMAPTVPFYALIPDRDAPQMPSALLCFLSALVPPLWVRWIAMPRLKDWDTRFATDEERVLAARANQDARWPAWN